jgi:hypothetical protein
VTNLLTIHNDRDRKQADGDIYAGLRAKTCDIARIFDPREKSVYEAEAYHVL